MSKHINKETSGRVQRSLKNGQLKQPNESVLKNEKRIR